MRLEKPDFQDNAILIFALKEGKENAYMFLLDEYHSRLHAYALSLVNDFAMAQDIVQSVFLKTWQFRTKLDAKFSIQSFLYKSVYNEFVNTYQKNQSMMVLQRKYTESLNEVVEHTDSEDLKKMIETVMNEIPNLPKKCQKVFVLSKTEGLTNIEIAEYLNISIKTVEAQITKAFSILRKKLGHKMKTVIFLLFGHNPKEKRMK